MNRRGIGDSGERQAAHALERSGMRILERNFRRPNGEIDIIAREGKTIVFVEVKLRSSMRYGSGAEAVDRAKQRHIVRTAALYLAEHQLDDVPVRFDIVEVYPDSLNHLRGAFDATELL